jgi:hypothetical protein
MSGRCGIDSSKEKGNGVGEIIISEQVCHMFLLICDFD